MNIRSIAFAGLIGTFGLANFAAADAALKSVAELNQNKAALAGQTIRAEGKVVKVNNGIMGRNFVHVQDGTGDANANTNNLVVTSKQTAVVGDQVSVTGVVVVNRDFGMGYNYPLLIEEATIAPKK
ncbi:MAG TPA: hypothetical protein VFF03_04460 [Rhodocyclaceae bacterium]|nr:hypothetical protein [Rhodocyclaceae bacterium]